MFENTPQEDEFFRQAVWYGSVLCIFLAPIPVTAISLFFGVDVNFGLFWIAWMFGFLWIHLAALYLIYHPVTLPLPTWLTSGHPVTFGGFRPDICDNSTLSLGWEGGHDWPCLPSEIGTRFANVTGPEGWKWLVQLDGKLTCCLGFLALNLMVCTMLMAELRKPRSDGARDAKSAPETKNDAESTEPGDCKKSPEAACSD